MKRPLPFGSNAVWPPLGWVAVFGLVYAMLDGRLWLIEHSAPSLSGQLTGLPEVMNVRAGILGTAAGFYGLYRLWRFHPACNSAYTGWLKTSPWTPRKPLPRSGLGCAARGRPLPGRRVCSHSWLIAMPPASTPRKTSSGPAATIRRLAAEQGMETLRSAGLRAIFSGCTTAEEFMRYL